jgi:hypothetical protein
LKSKRLHTLILALTAASLLTQSVLAGAGTCGSCCSTEATSAAKSCCQKAESKSCCETSTSCCSQPKRERTSACCCDDDPAIPPASPDQPAKSVASSLEGLTLSNELLIEPLIASAGTRGTASRILPAATQVRRQTVLCVWQI